MKNIIGKSLAILASTILFTSCTSGTSTTYATDIALDKTEATIRVGETLKLTPTVSPDSYTYGTIMWTTQDVSVASVSNGVVLGVKAGTTKVYCSINIKDNDKLTATCTFTVTE